MNLMSNYDHQLSGAIEAIDDLLDLLTGDAVPDLVGTLSGPEIAVIAKALHALGDPAGVDRWEDALRTHSETTNDSEDYESFIACRRTWQ